ncbi:MAG: DUF1292 domain-containing protein [Anaerococcus sp.]|nr:DUF1292 domain-containing protein [Anaerococcus sp.]
MSEKFNLHGHEVEFGKNEGKAIIDIGFGENVDQTFLVDIFTVDDTDYVALLSNDSSQIYLFYYNDNFDDDEVNLELIEDEEELEEVFHIFSHYWDEQALDNLMDDYENDLDSEDVIDE